MDEREEGYGEMFPWQTNHPLQTPNQSFASTNITLSPHSHNQEVDGESPSQSSPLGLTLTKTPSFLDLLQKSLDKAKQADANQLHPTKRADDLGIPSISEKMKASNFPAFYIRIGSWERITRHEGDLTAKFYYAKRKMVWEILEGSLKSKIEIQWSDISGIRAITPEDEPGTLEIELNQPPLFYREMNPQPRKHTLWQQASDFTGGQAPIWRIHHVRFPPGVLDKHYEKLVQCDGRLLKLTQNPFPTHESPYFDPNMFAITPLPLFVNAFGSNSQYPFNAYPSLPHPTMPAVDYSYTNGNQFMAPPTACWGKVMSPAACYQPSPDVGVMSQQWLGDSHAMRSLLEPTTTTYPYIHTTTGDNQAMATYDPMITEALYSHHLNCLPPQQTQCDAVLLMHHHQSNNTSLPPFYFQPADHTTTGGFFQ